MISSASSLRQVPQLPRSSRQLPAAHCHLLALRRSPLARMSRSQHAVVARSAAVQQQQGREDVDVAISGGGPAGLAVAHAILRACPGKTVRVYEAVDSFTPQGAGVLMNINGFRALEAIDPTLYQKLLERCMRLTASIWTSEEGEYIKTSPLFDHEGNMAKYGKTLMIVSWHDIRQTLYDALPPGVVTFGHRITGYTDDGSGSGAVTVQVAPRVAGEADSDSGAFTIKAGVLVGGDGYFSKIRKQTLDDGPPEFTGRLTWRARVEMSHSDDFLKENPTTARLFINPETIGKDRSSIIYPVGNNTYVWTANCPTWRLEKAGYTFDAFSPSRSNMGIQQTGITGTSAFERCLTCFDDYPKEFLDVVRATPAELVTEHGYYRRSPESMPAEVWGAGLVTLVGDAAHLAPPDGQGLNLALEDAAVLGWHLKQKGLTTEALRNFERERIPRVKGILSYGELHPERQKLVNEGVFNALAESV